jgi:hypothetical protein
MKSITAIAAAVLATVLIPLGGPAEAGADVRGLGRYQCTVEGGLAPSDTDLSLNLKRVPASLEPGEVLRLKGTLEITFPSEVGTQSQLQLANEAGLKSTNFYLAASFGEHSLQIKPATVTAEPQPIGSPFVVRASVEFGRVVVPDGASGDVVLAMPSEAQNRGGDAGDSVVFNAVVSQNSSYAEERKVDCSLFEGDQPGIVARIPIEDKESGPGDRPAGTDPEDPADPPSPAPPSDPTPAADAASVPDATSEPEAPPAEPGDETAAVQPSSSEATTASLVPSSAAIPPATKRPGTFVPTWTVLTMMAMLLGLTLAYAVRRRVVMATISKGPRRTSQVRQADDPSTTDN